MTKNANENTDALLAALAELEVVEGSNIEDNKASATPDETSSDVEPSDVEPSDVESLLASLELDAPVLTETSAVTPSTEEISDDVLQVLETSIAIEEAKLEAYEPKSEKTYDADVSLTAADPVKSKPANVDKAAPKPKARASGDSKPSAALIARLGNVDAVYSQLVFTPDDATLSAEELKIECDKRLKSFDELPKKIGEKAVNLVMHLSGCMSLSVYTQIALEMLFTSGELSSKALVERYMARPYSEGTSRSQAGQIMRLVQAFGIASGSTSHVTLNKNSIIGQALHEALIGKAA